MRRPEPELLDLREAKEESWEPAPPEAGSIAQEGEGEAPEAALELPDLSAARSLLTEPRPAGFGEVLVTDVWFRPPPPEHKETEGDEEAPPVERGRRWEVLVIMSEDLLKEDEL